MPTNIFEIVKANVTARQAAELYGCQVGRSGMMCCLFHEDRHPSMKVDERYYCFGCQATGDAVDLTARLFDLSPKAAAEKLAADFGLAGKEESVPPMKFQRAVQQDQKKWMRHAIDVLMEYESLLAQWKEEFKPGRTDEELHPLYTEALYRIDRVEYLLDIALPADPMEREAFCRGRQKEVEKIERRIEEYHGVHREGNHGDAEPDGERKYNQ